MRITKEGRFAVRGLIDLALNASSSNPVKSDEIAKRMGISKIFLNKIFHRLLKEGIILSVRGRSGGYILAKNVENISVYEILEAAGEIIKPVSCVNDEDFPSICLQFNECLISPVWQILESKIKETLSKVSLGDVINRKVVNIFES
ncbi:MAG: Rrf2 family transcriptional regulator [Candidatus Delongbacteria bacterium]|nr:Rrf2 family transcriptional regulator [Candidatus Delongbacteria bacterium]MBN2834531.1 Rrf2 family transcriptional regulator [Candidatus Delongbacteria bacterium]